MSSGKKRKRKNRIGAVIFKTMAVCIIGTLFGFTMAMLMYIIGDYVENRGQNSEPIELVDVEIIRNEVNFEVDNQEEEIELDIEDRVCFESEMWTVISTPFAE